MRACRYFVMNKSTYKVVFYSLNSWECHKFLENMADKENYGIAHKWLSI